MEKEEERGEKGKNPITKKWFRHTALHPEHCSLCSVLLFNPVMFVHSNERKRGRKKEKEGERGMRGGGEQGWRGSNSRGRGGRLSGEKTLRGNR